MQPHQADTSTANLDQQSQNTATKDEPKLPPLTEFQIFPKLLPELKTLVYRHAIGSSVAQVTAQSLQPGHGTTVSNRILYSPPEPELAFVSKELREEALKVYYQQTTFDLTSISNTRLPISRLGDETVVRKWTQMMGRQADDVRHVRAKRTVRGLVQLGEIPIFHEIDVFMTWEIDRNPVAAQPITLSAKVECDPLDGELLTELPEFGNVGGAEACVCSVWEAASVLAATTEGEKLLRMVDEVHSWSINCGVRVAISYERCRKCSRPELSHSSWVPPGARYW